MKVDSSENDDDLHVSQILGSSTKADKRGLSDLESVDAATISDLKELGITEVSHLVDRDARELFTHLQNLKGRRLDPCCEDVFRVAIEQARDPNLPAAKRKWHYWTGVRKSQLSN